MFCFSRYLNIKVISVLALLAFARVEANLIDNFPSPSEGIIHPFGEIMPDDPSFSLAGKPQFASYYGQTFTALAGLATTLTVDLTNPPVFDFRPDGVDFSVLIVETRRDRIARWEKSADQRNI